MVRIRDGDADAHEHGLHGVHTMNADGGTIVYDAYSLRFSPFAWLYRLKERFR